MGTAIDESLDGEIRVTVVATGLGPHTKTQAPVQQAPAEVKIVKTAITDEKPDYAELEKPTAIRKQKTAAGEAISVNGEYNEEMLDIPAFLRRQAD